MPSASKGLLLTKDSLIRLCKIHNIKCELCERLSLVIVENEYLCAHYNEFGCVDRITSYTFSGEIQPARTMRVDYNDEHFVFYAGNTVIIL